MNNAPTLDDVFAVMSAASYGDTTARVALQDDPKVDHVPTKFGLALNVLLDDLSFRAKESERLAERLRALASAAHEFSAATQDQDRLLDTVALRLATIMGDVCVVMLLSDDGQMLVPTSAHSPDKEVEGRVRAFYFNRPRVLETHPISHRQIASGEPYLVSKIDLEQLRATTTPDFVEYVKGMGLHSFLLVQLRVEGRSIGQLVLTRYRTDRPGYDEDDVKFATALADHAALAISNARSYAAERAARAAAEKAQGDQRASEERYRLMFDKSPLPKWMYDAQTLRFLAVNDAAIHDYGYSREEFLAMTIKDIRLPEDVPALLEAERDADITPKFGVWKHLKKNGTTFLVEVTKHSFMLGERACRIAVGRDVTERTRLEEQLRQSQKMDAVGRLAGGVAHDFNNLLSVILCYGELLAKEMKPGDPMRDDVEEIKKAGMRAASLTRQLLMFSRQQVIEPKVLDLNEVLGDMDKMLQRILGADVDLVSLLAQPLGRVRADPSSVEQIIMNLVVNARDSAAEGGCVCPAGYITNGQSGAALVCMSACTIANGGCGSNASCSIESGVIACACNPGYVSESPVGTDLNCSIVDGGMNSDMDGGPCGQLGEACCPGATCVENGEIICAHNQCVIDYNWTHWVGVPPAVTPSSQFLVSSDGLTVTDSSTGLIWEQTPSGNTGLGGISWSDAITSCEELSLGNYISGWRMPTLVELQTLLDYDPSIPNNAEFHMINPTVFPNGGGSWVASIVQDNVVWLVDFGWGNIGSVSPQSNALASVSCVRSTDTPGEAGPGPGAPPGRYVISNGGTADGTVYDVVTQLTWQQTTPGAAFTWSSTEASGSAQEYCQTLSLGGFTSGWRLPSVKELGSIVDAETYNPTLDDAFLPSGPLDSLTFWAATNNPAYGTAATQVSFVGGTISYDMSPTISEFDVRCVR